MREKTLQAPRGGEFYMEISDHRGEPVTLTYNDLWTLIICRAHLQGDWVRASEVAASAPDGERKRALVHRLWELELNLGKLPEIPPTVEKLHLQRALVWFNQQTVSENKNW